MNKKIFCTDYYLGGFEFYIEDKNGNLKNSILIDNFYLSYFFNFIKEYKDTNVLYIYNKLNDIRNNNKMYTINDISKTKNDVMNYYTKIERKLNSEYIDIYNYFIDIFQYSINNKYLIKIIWD